MAKNIPVSLSDFSRVTKISDSENLEVLAYDPEKNVMLAMFVSGGSYLYHNVEPSIFGTLVAAKSVGTAFISLIRNNAKYRFTSLGTL